MIRAVLILLLCQTAAAQFTIPRRSGATAATSGGGGATVTYVQGGTPATGASNVVACSTTASVASGDIVITMSKEGNTGTGGTVAFVSTAGPTITFTTSTALWNSGGNYNANVGWGVAPTAGTETVTTTWTGGTANGFVDCSLAVLHSTTGWQATPLDVQISAMSTIGTTSCLPGTTATTTNARDLVVAACFNFNAGQTYTAVSGYTFQSASSRNTTAFYWKQATTTGTQTISIPITSDDFIAFLITFKPN